MRTKENIVRHELIGLNAMVSESRNKAQIGLKGRIIDETEKMVTLATKGDASVRKTIPKKGTIFRVALNHEKIDIDGDVLLGRPEDRIKKKIKRW